MRSACIFFLCFVVSCAGDRSETNNKQDSAVSIPTPVPKTNFSDTLVISNKSAVFYQPDSLQIEKAKQESREEDFMAGADDYIFYMNESAEYLEKKGITILNSKGRRYLKFMLYDGSMQVVKLDTIQELWGVFLFEPSQKPRQADITSIEEEYRNYYH
jgi:hypothetical protein